MSVTQRLISRDIAARQETRRATVLTDLVLEPFDPAGGKSFVWTVRVDIGQKKPVDGVIVKTQTGRGGRGYAQAGSSVIIQRNEGGRWICIGPSDRIRGVGNVQLLDESDNTSAAGPGTGLRTERKTYDFYQGQLPGVPGSGLYGSKGYGNSRIFDGAGNEVT